jgi:hypothetical protein
VAGDWIKVEHATLDKPEVAYFAELLGMNVDEALGILLRFWVWLDRNARNGCVTHVTQMSLDKTMHCEGFTGALVTVKWVELDTDACTLHVPNFERHNENSSKTRTSNAERQARYRDKHRNKSNAISNVTSNAVTLPEKRREDKELKSIGRFTPDCSPGFQRFWAAYPNHSNRRKNRAACVVLWNRLSLESKADLVVGHVEAMKRTKSWQPSPNGESFEPEAERYLRKRNWEDGMPELLSATKRPSM